MSFDGSSFYIPQILTKSSEYIIIFMKEEIICRG
ncbi:MAG: hypothetical protein YFSK_3730 [Candidatus Yanofskyibacterium parasiticum]|nr:MAG: hypothetical protein YFSK_3730 [Candidatus Yanofskybacteria bacterium]